MRFGIWELLIILVIVVLLFGTKRIKSLGGDLGTAIKSFRSAVRDGESESLEKKNDAENRVIEGESHTEQGNKHTS
ncbi:MAG: twin-arginine translocase TatA/TatE family subunit [Gammaproteobacteria bacterium]|nr:twin-arginine translocase TatA/TatE family subunit [Gammaproteobacteria bacterium]